uniref:OTU domain-containing protein n=1 Tax=Oncorhynchus tshawytscha TaxID=74940 RepID=A0A8C8CPW0_ONCTS
MDRYALAILKQFNISSVLMDIFSQYMYIREIRGDGNCFYRTLCFGHLESLLQKDRNSFKYLLNMVNVHASLPWYYFLKSRFSFSLVTLLQLFNEQTTFDSLVQYLRLLTLAYLQNHADFFSHFVEARSLKVYCTQEVETMAMECDHIDILALSEALMERLGHHTIPEGTQPSLHLLYKTAHYDILYPHHCH